MHNPLVFLLYCQEEQMDGPKVLFVIPPSMLMSRGRPNPPTEWSPLTSHDADKCWEHVKKGSRELKNLACIGCFVTCCESLCEVSGLNSGPLESV